ncbi:MAG: VWA domain-containing protein [Polyangiaceae bacterium]|nr:VWA domain-containing protein [Polyangiaceae bacterium]
MTALAPLAFALIALAVPMALAYLWQKRTEKRRVSSILILRKVAVPTEPPKRGFARPRHVASFILVVLGLVAAAFAIADLRREDETPRDLIVVLDTSASMGTVEEDGTRLEIARRELRDAVASLRSGDRIALVTTGTANVVRVGLTEDTTYALEVASTLVADGTSDKASSAIELADAICKSSGRGRILLLSDGVGVNAPQTTCEVDHRAIGSDVANAGITELSVREGDAFGLHEVHVGVTSVLRQKQRAEVALLAGDRVVELVAFDLPPRGKAERLVRLELPAGAELSAELRLPEKDALAADDFATAPRVEGGQVKTVLVTAGEKSFASEALRLHPRVDLTLVRANTPFPADVDPQLIVLEALPEGGVPKVGKRIASFGLPPAVLGLQEGVTTQSPDIVRWAYADPLFRYVDLQGVKVPTGIVVEPRAGQRTLIEAEQGALAVLDTQDQRETLYLGFAPHESDLVLRVGFVNMIANLVEWASEASNIGERKGVLSATESWVHPPTNGIKGTNERSRSKDSPPFPLWRMALVAAFALVATELLAQSVIGSREKVRTRWSSWRSRRKAKVASEQAEKGGSA